MAHIILTPIPGSPGAMQLVINGIDYSDETFRGVDLVEVGEGEYAEVGLRVTFAVGRLDLGGESNVQVTDHFPAVVQRVRSMVDEAEAASA